MTNFNELDIIENHKRFTDRLSTYKSFGYDFMAERDYVLRQCLPLNGEILEIGTGKGHFSIALAKAGHKFTSIDINEEEQNFALLNLRYFGVENNVKLKIENAEQINYPNNFFDAIISVNLIHHLQNPYKVIDEMLRIAALDGKIIISDFTEHGFETIQNIHKSEGRFHETNNIFISDIEKYISAKGFKTNRTASAMQDVLIISINMKGLSLLNLMEPSFI